MNDKPKKYYAMCSFGKDSLATILLALQHGEPLDGAIFSEVMYDHSRGISGENPKHIRWINEEAIPKLNSMGVEVIRLRGERDYLHYFHSTIQGKSRWAGYKHGYPLSGMCAINRDCKFKPIKAFLREQRKDFDIVEYVGIAIDEPIRLKRLIGGGKSFQMSLLAKYEYTEQMACELCTKFDLLSPIYDDSSRGGCWFCPNAKLTELVSFRKENPDLWREFLDLAKTPNLCSDKFNRTGLTLPEIDKKLDQIEQNKRRQLSFDF